MANQSEQDALALEVQPAETSTTAGALGRFSLELAAGSLRRTTADPTTSTWRTSLDWIYTHKLSSQSRFTVSNRLDAFEPRDQQGRRLVNSLREAYASWASEDGKFLLDAGRIQLKLGPAIGYNPTDYFRDSSLRTMPTVDPVSLREMRLGAAMLRLQRLTSSGSISLALSPKLANESNTDPFSADFGSTNQANRALLSLSNKWSERLSTQAHLYKREGESAQLGLSASALASNSSIIYAEWSGAREIPSESRFFSESPRKRLGYRSAIGWTYTSDNNLSTTIEFQANTFGLTRSDWGRLNAVAPSLLQAHVANAVRDQDLAPRKAILIYTSKRDFMGAKNLTLTGFIQSNLEDDSRLYWLELRQKWAAVELAAQLQRTSGGPGSEYTYLQRRQSIQLLTLIRF